MNGPELAVGAVAVSDDQLLLVRRGHGPAAGEWSVPGGRVERGEPVEAAVVREVLEETGLDVVVDELLGWVERLDDDRHFVILDFRVTVLDPDASVRPGARRVPPRRRPRRLPGGRRRPHRPAPAPMTRAPRLVTLPVPSEASGSNVRRAVRAR